MRPILIPIADGKLHRRGLTGEIGCLIVVGKHDLLSLDFSMFLIFRSVPNTAQKGLELSEVPQQFRHYSLIAGTLAEHLSIFISVCPL